MKQTPKKIKFRKSNSNFYKELQQQVNTLVTAKTFTKANRLMIFKFATYSLLCVSLYSSIYVKAVPHNQLIIVLTYIAYGFTALLLAFNSAHDAVHHTFSKTKWVNDLVFYLTFNLQGTNGRLWRKRHISSHHIFPNVDDCDADFDNNPFIRLSVTHPLKKHHRFQHLYALPIYCLYTLHWIIIKDFIYLRKKKVANISVSGYSFWFWLEVIALKIAYFSWMIFLPAYFSTYQFSEILIAFLLMHVVISVFFILTLIISHLTMETAFPVCDEHGFLPTDYYEHQLAVSLDYHPNSKLASWIFGGFNAHAAHHLFPSLPHTVYALITPSIKATAAKYDLKYNEKSIPAAVLSHFNYLKKLGTRAHS